SSRSPTSRGELLAQPRDLRRAVRSQRCEQPAVAVVVARGERRLVALQHHGLPRLCVADVLETEAELVRPEERCVRVRLLGAGDRRGDRARLAGRARPVLDATAAPGGDVAARVDVRRRAAAARIDLDGVDEAPDADDDDVGVDRGAVRQANGLDAVAAVEALDADSEAQVDAASAVAVGEQAPHLRAEHALERHREWLDDGHGGHDARDGGGDLAADEARADDDDARVGAELRPQRVGVVERPQVVDTVGPLETPRPHARREHERVPLHEGVADAGRAAPRVDLLDAAAEHELDRLLVPESLRAQRDILPIAGEQLLGERGPLVRRVLLVADEQHAAVEASCAERLRAARAGEAGARDEDRAGHAAATSSTVIAPIGHESAASSAAGSSVSAFTTDAMPPDSRRKRSGARSTQAPNPLQRDVSIEMQYLLMLFAPFDGGR